MLTEDRVRQLSADAAFTKGGTTMQAPQRERGLWSFLTWSFFLSQLAIGNAFSAGAAQAGTGVDLNAPDGTASPSSAANALGTPDFRAVSMSEPGSAGPPVAAAQVMTGTVNADAKPAVIEQVDQASDAGVATQAALARSSGASEVAASDAASGTLPPESVPGVVPGIEIPTVVELPPVLGGVLPPILETVDNLLDGLGPTLDGLLVPVVETVEDLAGALGPTLDHVLAPGVSVVDGLVGGLQPTLDPLLAPVASIADGLGEALEPIGSVAGEIIGLANPVFDAAESVLSPFMNVVDAAQPILDPVLEVAAPVVNLIEPVVEPLLQPLAPALEPVVEILPLSIGNSGLLSGIGGGGSDAVASSGSLEFALSANVTAHDLFQAGIYTEFGITLHETSAGDEIDGGDLLGNVTEMVGSLLGDVEDAGQGLPAAIGNLAHEIGLRGLGEGLI